MYIDGMTIIIEAYFLVFWILFTNGHGDQGPIPGRIIPDSKNGT